ncbi:hypothetical protein CPB84DRAFT_1674314 [Gymnopilus junonius]|uniref:Citrate transporter-like domain-containing protein n=1 Tax=Gymnopilus junonius TaxID=109634 RepID=A0A9P5NT85_GYMJU|nr:hypothetical protein CPB84DRAFT_1674314 [Gymnopilus junonius]
MVSGSAIATLVVFILSIICVIYPFSFPVYLPYLKRRRIPVDLTTAPIIAILVLWAAQCLGPGQVRSGTDGVKPYNILILFFSLAYMAITLDITGILQAAAFWVSNKGGSNGWKLFLYFYMMLTALSVVLGNDPVILSGTAFLVYYTKVNELNPVAWLMSEFAAANTASMVLFVGNPTNVVVCEGFQINNAAFTAYTILPFLACIVTSFFALALQFHSQKYLPKKLNVSGDLDVRSVLLDPKGALVGSLLLGTCLVVIIVVSFFHVDVWKISLPFAVAKFVFDMGWDHYRYMNKISMIGAHKAKKSDEDLSQAEDDIVLSQLAQHRTNALKDEGDGKGEPNERSSKAVTFEKNVTSEEPIPSLVPSPTETRNNTRSNTADTLRPGSNNKISPSTSTPLPIPFFQQLKLFLHSYQHRISVHFPTIYTAFPRLPFALVPFAFSQFILIEALAHQGWIDIFARWLVIATGRRMYPTIWVVGVLGVILCNLSGTNIGATILLTKIVRSALLASAGGNLDAVNLNAFSRSAGIALAVASNIGAVSFTFSASLAGLLWKQILNQKGIHTIKQGTFARWNILPIMVMTGVGMAVVSAEMAVLY